MPQAVHRDVGGRVYLGLAVVLVSSGHAWKTPAAVRLGEGEGIPIRTLERWRQWWQTEFSLTPLWRAQCARFMPPVVPHRLPGELLERFTGEAQELLMRLRLCRVCLEGVAEQRMDFLEC